MREKHQALLGDRVQLLGPVKHEEVRDVSASLKVVFQSPTVWLIDLIPSPSCLCTSSSYRATSLSILP